MSIYTTTGLDSTTYLNWRDMLQYSTIHAVDDRHEPESIQYVPITNHWFRTNSVTLSSDNTITWDTTLTDEQINKLITIATQSSSMSRSATTVSDFRDKSTQFCLEQDDPEIEEESDETLPEFLDTFEVKEGERMDV